MASRSAPRAVPATSSPSAPARTTTSSASRSHTTARTATARPPARPATSTRSTAARSASSTPAGTGCTAAAITQTLTGKIALINRGVCTFSEKVAAAKAKGAIARHRRQQRRRRPDRDGRDRGLRRRHPRSHDLEGRRRRAPRLGRHQRHRRRLVQRVHHGQRRHPGRLLEPGPDVRRLRPQAGSHLRRRQRPQLRGVRRRGRLRQRRRLGVLQRDVDVFAARRRLGGRAQAAPSDLVAGQDQVGPRQHRGPGGHERVRRVHDRRTAAPGRGPRGPHRGRRDAPSPCGRSRRRFGRISASRTAPRRSPSRSRT